MRKFSLIAGAVMLCFSARAQSGKIKPEDIVTQHKKTIAPGGKTSAGSMYESKEKENYHLQRWLWYWKQHTDQDGYLVPKIEAYRTWEAYRAENKRALAKTTADQSDWKALGPYSHGGVYLEFQKHGIGRINVMAFHPTDGDEFVVGTAGGGAWITKDYGASWAPITQNLMSAAISDIDYNPQNPQTIYICTGDRDAIPALSEDRDYNSIGLIRSYDGGQTWDTTGLSFSVPEVERTNALLINPADTNSLTIATRNSILKSYDGGATWQKAFIPHTPGSDWVRGYIPELVYHPTDTSVVYASTMLVQIHPQFGPISYSVELLKSTDGGATWKVSGIITDAIRAATSVTQASPGMVKIIVANSSFGLEGIYHSSDAGENFTQIFNDNNCQTNLLASSSTGQECGGQGFYDLCIAIDPADTNHIVVGGVNTWESKDGGYSWNLMTQASLQVPNIPLVHADHHYLGFHPTDNNLFNCNDGGIYCFMPNPLLGVKIWSDLSQGINMTQYYRVAAPGNKNYVIGGAQDVGSNLLDRNTKLSNVVGWGDGMECAVHPDNSDIIITGSQNGTFVLWDLSKTISWGNLNVISSNIPTSSTDKEGAWTTPLLVSPHDPNTLIVGYKAVYVSNDLGDTWSKESGEFGNVLGRLAATKASAGTLYATEDGKSNNIHFTHDTATSWTTIQHPYNEPRISDIKVDHTNAKRFWVTFPGFGQNKTKVAMYDDGTWTTMNENLPDLPVYCIVQDTADKTLYIGTYTGVYYRTPKMNRWEPFSNNLPLVNVTDLDINYKTGELLAGTWGRGMWITNKYQEPKNVTDLVVGKAVLNVYPNPGNGIFSVEAADDVFKNANVTVQISDMTGKKVYSQNGRFTGSKLAVQAQGLAPGNYILQLTDTHGHTVNEKLVIQRK